jgi:ABC-type multidrug transport system fused ATPase/permease subunit
MLHRSIPFAMISMIHVPLMLLATIWFSNQARKAFRLARREIGDVSADLQENISGVREAQAFSREDENIARFRQANAANVCMNVVGHTSRTGSEPVNDRLSQARAAVIKQKLEAEVGQLATRTRASGMGWRENIVGTGTDDVSDALDRRVEFKIVDC